MTLASTQKKDEASEGDKLIEKLDIVKSTLNIPISS